MKKLSIIATLIVVALAGRVEATHSHPKQAKQFKLSFVTAYNQCTAPTLSHRPPVPFPSCAPALTTDNNPLNKVTFGPNGSAQAIIKVATGDVKITFKAKDILNNGLPYGGSLEAYVVLRITDHACGAMPPYTTPCTVVDFPLQIPIGCTVGTCKGAFTINLLIAGMVVVGDEGNVELGQIVVRDPDMDHAFRQGLFLP